MKSTWTTGEIAALKKIPNIELHRVGKGFYKILDDRFTEGEHRTAAAKALALLREKIASAKFQLIILDEVNVAADLKLLDPADVLALIAPSPAPLQTTDYRLPPAPLPHFILTGRNAPQLFLDAADLVTEMREIKHPFQKGIKAVKGLDY